MVVYFCFLIFMHVDICFCNVCCNWRLADLTASHHTHAHENRTNFVFHLFSRQMIMHVHSLTHSMLTTPHKFLQFIVLFARLKLRAPFLLFLNSTKLCIQIETNEKKEFYAFCVWCVHMYSMRARCVCSTKMRRSAMWRSSVEWICRACKMRSPMTKDTKNSE